MRKLALTLGLALACSAADYDPQLSSTIMAYTSAAFCERSILASWQCGAACQSNPEVGAVTVVSDAIAGTYGYVAYNNKTDTIIAAFRGTVNNANFNEDVDFYKIQYPLAPEGALAHEGFYHAYQTLSRQVIAAASQYRDEHPSAKFIITGHSLGAALSTFAALDIKEQLKPATETTFYTYGSPRVGNDLFADYIFSHYPNGTYQRIVHTNDIYTHMPFTSFGFKHAGDEVWYDTDLDYSAYLVCKNQPGVPENPNCSSTLFYLEQLSHWTYLGLNITGQCFGYSKMSQPTLY